MERHGVTPVLGLERGTDVEREPAAGSGEPRITKPHHPPVVSGTSPASGERIHLSAKEARLAVRALRFSSLEAVSRRHRVRCNGLARRLESQLAALGLLVALAVGCVGAPATPAELAVDASAASVLERPAVTPVEPLRVGACFDVFEHVADAWEELLGPLAAECRALAEVYEVRLVRPVPCGEGLHGCVRYAERAIYVLEGASPAGRVFTAAHEWLHALARCADGDGNGDHSDLALWDLEDGVLGLAVEGLPVGPCVGVP